MYNPVKRTLVRSAEIITSGTLNLAHSIDERDVRSTFQTLGTILPQTGWKPVLLYTNNLGLTSRSAIALTQSARIGRRIRDHQIWESERL